MLGFGVELQGAIGFRHAVWLVLGVGLGLSRLVHQASHLSAARSVRCMQAARAMQYIRRHHGRHLTQLAIMIKSIFSSLN